MPLRISAGAVFLHKAAQTTPIHPHKKQTRRKAIRHACLKTITFSISRREKSILILCVALNYIRYNKTEAAAKKDRTTNDQILQKAG